MPLQTIAPTGLSDPIGFAAGSAPLDVLLGLFMLLVGAKLGEEIARRLGQPAVVGELVGGFVVGPHLLGFVTPGESALEVSEIGVVILLFAVGLEVRFDDLFAVGRPAAATAVVGWSCRWPWGSRSRSSPGRRPAPPRSSGSRWRRRSLGITSRVLAEMKVMGRGFAWVVPRAEAENPPARGRLPDSPGAS